MSVTSNVFGFYCHIIHDLTIRVKQCRYQFSSGRKYTSPLPSGRGLVKVMSVTPLNFRLNVNDHLFKQFCCVLFYGIGEKKWIDFNML